MEKNECTSDRVVRVILGMILLYVGAIYMELSGILSYIVVIVGLLLLVTGLIGFCLLYSVLGMNTCKPRT